jgi:hypothetical protein
MHNPRYVSSYATEEFRGDVDSLNLSSYMFPGSSDLSLHGIPPTPFPSSGTTFGSNHKQSPQKAFPTTNALQPSYFPPALPPTARRQPPIRSHSLPYSYYPTPMAQPQPQFPPSPQSPQSPSPVTPSTNFPIPIATSKVKEPQIRLNENCYNYKLQRHETLPLDPGSFGTSALSQAHFTNSDFQPQMWNAEEEYGRHD